MHFFSISQPSAVAAGPTGAIRLPQVQEPELVAAVPSVLPNAVHIVGLSILQVGASPATQVARLHASSQTHRAQMLAQSRTTIRRSAKRW